VAVRRRPDGVIEAVMFGYQNAATITTMLDGIKSAMKGGAATGVLFDATAIEGFAPDVRVPGVEMLRFIKSSGLPRAVAVVSVSAVRMMAAAISFAAGLPLDMYATRAEAEARLASGVRR
jgi:hypothetical protein